MNVEMSDIVLLGIIVGVAAVALIVGAALGAYSAFHAMREYEEKAWDAGYRAGTYDAESAMIGLNSESERSLNPHKLRGPFPRRTKKTAPNV